MSQYPRGTLGGYHYMPHAGENHAPSTSFTRHATQIDQMHTECRDRRQLRGAPHRYHTVVAKLSATEPAPYTC